MIVPLLLLMQAGTAAPPPGSERFSILAAPCAPNDAHQGDIVVCGRGDAASQRLPLPAYRGVPDHPVPSNPDMTGIAALNGPAIANECGAYGEDCPVGLGGPAIPKLIEGVSSVAHNLFARRPDRRGRVAIDLSPPPIPANAIRP